jgi:Spy/CpxP family protein refolding chaperone
MTPSRITRPLASFAHSAIILVVSLIVIPMFATLVLATPMFASVVFANKQSPSLDKRVTTMTKNLTLTSEQATKVRPILEAQDKAMQSIRQVNKGNRDARKKEVKARMATEAQFNRTADAGNREAFKVAIQSRDSVFEKEMSAVLSAEQYKKFLDSRLKK